MTSPIPRTTRQSILDALRIEQICWWGELDEVAFLSRIFDLDELPSYDVRFDTAAGDIWQHRVNNNDWDDDWVYTDRRLNLLGCADQQFLDFLCELVHPLVRPDRAEAESIVALLNPTLSKAGFRLSEVEQIAGRPRFQPIKVSHAAGSAVNRASVVSATLDAGWMEREISRLERSVDDDPALAIGTSKDLLESCLKTILSQRKVEYRKAITLPALTKLVLSELELVPEGISESAKGAETIRLLLRTLSAIPGYMAEIRGLYGSGHGRAGRYRGLEPRHARLAVGATVTLIDFLAETHRKRPKADQ